LKIIRPESAEDPVFAERFGREARALARLGHPNIVAVYDFGEVTVPDERAEDATPLFYILMEYVDGANLRQLMQDGDLESGPALTIIPQICEALQYAHDEGVVHRDIKPENILVDTKGQVKIADFGLARLVSSSPQDFTLTGAQQVMGTPRYMAPEQMAASHDVDHRADIYSLGVVFYEMLTGEVPMGQFEPPSKKVAVDGRLDEVVLRALAREPEHRFQQASDMKASVEEISSYPGPERRASIPQDGRHDVRIAWKWIAFMTSIAGALMIALPWIDVELVQLENSDTHRFRGYEVWPGVAAAVAFVSLALLLITTSVKQRLRIWRPVVMTGIAAFALLFTILFRMELEDHPFSFLWLENDDRQLAFASSPLHELEHRITYLPAFYGALGLSAALLLLGGINILQAFNRSGQSSREGGHTTDPPLTSLRFTAVADQDIGPQIVFHFSGLGYRLVDEQPNAWVFRRGKKSAGFWTSPFCTDVRTYYTTLTINTTPGNSGELLLSCVWAVRTWGAWFGGRDIRQLETEGRELELLLGGGDDRKSGDLATVTSPTYSVAAIIGAVLSLVLVTMAAAVFGHLVVGQDAILLTEDETQTKDWTLPLILGGLAVILGSTTTLLGIVSMNDIRNSPGKVVGRGLAFATAIVFPLLVLDAMIYALLLLAVGSISTGSTMAVVFAPLIWFIVDFFLIILAWRIVLRALDAPDDSFASIWDEQSSPTWKSRDLKPPRQGTG
jgi:hypothetical protein